MFEKTTLAISRVVYAVLVCAVLGWLGWVCLANMTLGWAVAVFIPTALVLIALFALHVGVWPCAKRLHEKTQRHSRLVRVEGVGVLLEVGTMQHSVHQPVMESFVDLWLGLVDVGTQRLEGATVHCQRNGVCGCRSWHQPHPGWLGAIALLEDE